MQNIDSICIEKLKKIFKDRFSIHLNQFGDDSLDKNLLSHEMGLSARDLVYIFFDVEKEFEITIPQNYIAEGRFNTFNNILDIIKRLKDNHS